MRALRDRNIPNKLISLIASATLILSLMPIAAFAAMGEAASEIGGETTPEGQVEQAVAEDGNGSSAPAGKEAEPAAALPQADDAEADGEVLRTGDPKELGEAVILPAGTVEEPAAASTAPRLTDLKFYANINPLKDEDVVDFSIDKAHATIYVSDAYSLFKLEPSWEGEHTLKAEYIDTNGARQCISYAAPGPNNQNLKNLIATGSFDDRQLKLYLDDELAYTIDIVRVARLKGKVIVAGSSADPYEIRASDLQPNGVCEKEFDGLSSQGALSVKANTYNASTSLVIDGAAATPNVTAPVNSVWKDGETTFDITVGEGQHATKYTFKLKDPDYIAPIEPDPQPEPTPPAGEEGSFDAVSFDKAYAETGSYLGRLADQYVPAVSSTGGEWQILGLVRADYTPDPNMIAAYYENVEAHVKTEINEKEQLHKNKATENERVIVALTALGKDVTDVAGHNLLAGLTDMAYLKKQGINGVIWALIAFDCGQYEIPEAPTGAQQATRDGMIEFILGKQLADGGWALSGSASDPDMTAMALQALAPYYKTNSAVKAAVDKAIGLLSAMQRDNGGYASWGTVNSESCAQVIVALTGLGINPATDARFVKNGKSVVDALLEFAVEGGGFRHSADGAVNGMASEQGYYALAAVDRFMNGKTWLYDMSDVNAGDQNSSGDGDSGSLKPDDEGEELTEDPKDEPKDKPADDPKDESKEESVDDSKDGPQEASKEESKDNGKVVPSGLGSAGLALGGSTFAVNLADPDAVEALNATYAADADSEEATAATRHLIEDNLNPLAAEAGEVLQGVPWQPFAIALACAAALLAGVLVARRRLAGEE